MYWILTMCLLMLVQAVRSGRENCLCSRVYHPQQKFCNADFAFRVEILDGFDSPEPGEPDHDQLYYQYFMYTVQIVEVFKGMEVFMSATADDILDIYTPQSGMCGRLTLYDDEELSNEYLITGTFHVSPAGVKYAAITGCTWVEKWSELTELQIEGLRGSYRWCNCTIFPVSGELFAGRPARRRFRLNTCVYNPVSASVLQVADCEDHFGFCDWDREADMCTWRYEGEYQECYDLRYETLSDIGKPAIASKKDCSLYSGRKKRQCKLKFLKANRRS